MEFPSQKQTTFQEYEFSIRYFSECIPKDAATICKELNDYILVKLISGTGRVLGVKVFHLADGSNPARWQIGTIRFNTTDNNLVTVSRLMFLHVFDESCVYYFAVFNLDSN